MTWRVQVYFPGEIQNISVLLQAQHVQLDSPEDSFALKYTHFAI